MFVAKSWNTPGTLTKHDLIRQMHDLLRRLIACETVKPHDVITFHQLTRDIEALETAYGEYADNLMGDRYHALNMKRELAREEAKEWIPKAHTKPWPDERR